VLQRESRAAFFVDAPLDSTVIEICTRLGLALVLSVTLAVLLAWGWDSSDPLPIDSDRIVEAPAAQMPAQ
jgi:hypothetical protein